MEFCKIGEKSITQGRGSAKVESSREIFPSFMVGKATKDLMIRGHDFYAIWDPKTGLWSTDQNDVQRIVDDALNDYAYGLKKDTVINVPVYIRSMEDYSSKSWVEFRRYVTSAPDNYHDLDCKLVYQDTDVKLEDYASHKLPYSLADGDHSAWDKLVDRLYAPEEKRKLEWAIGSIVSGDSQTIQKFVVLYGEGGTGKSTILNIIEKLFEGYCASIDAKALGDGRDQFSTELFKENPLVCIQQDADLSKIEDNTKLNSIIAHESIIVNEKRKTRYTMKCRSFIFLGTNHPVRITDGRSGIIRRLIDVRPTGALFEPNEYEALMTQIDFQLGAIAKRCLNVYRALGKNYYKNYVAKDMLAKTNVFYNFIEEVCDELQEEEGITLARAYAMYKEYCDESLVEYKLPKYKFREELKVYYDNYDERTRIDGKQVRCWYSGFKVSKVEPPVLKREEKPLPMVLDCTKSPLDILLAHCPAQYAKDDESPRMRWDDVTSILTDIDVHKLHYILPRLPEGTPPLVMVDFDLKNENGEKDMLLNLEAASKFPPTYAEFSKGGAGVHLFYFYTGDIDKVAISYAPGIEIKVFRGHAAIRRRLSKCNNIPVATISSGLPLKEEKMIDVKELNDELHLRNVLKKCLRKANHGATRPEVDLIKKVLDDAYASGMKYDVSDMQHDILVFAMHSSHQSDYCVKLVRTMKFKCKEAEEAEKEVKSDRSIEKNVGHKYKDDDPIVFFDIEMYPPGIDSDGEENEGLFLVCWKYAGEGNPVIPMVNPKPSEIEELFKMKLVGFNNRSYDNHMLYARYLGYDNARLYDLSHRIISEKSREALFSEAYDVSFTDVLDFSTNKQNLKQWEIDLKKPHVEMDIPWTQPAPKRLWEKIITYCSNDVRATEAVYEHCHDDWLGREILADIADGKPNDTTNSLSQKFVFEGDRHPQLVYTDLATGRYDDGSGWKEGNPNNAFPGYEYKFEDGSWRNMYRGVDLGRGGYSYSEPGIYYDVGLIDVRSLHPHSMIAMNYFGKYTGRFKEILDARLAIKDGDYDRAKKMFNGKIAKYLDDPKTSDGLAQALKIVINSAYGLTSASFPNAMRDPRNKNNIVALRGALFMKTLLDDLQSRGNTVAHLKVDSLKLPGATPETIEYCMKFAEKYGYVFEHEAFYDRLCLIDKANYIAAYATPERCMEVFGYVPKANAKHFKKYSHPWTATGDAFQRNYIFKTMFSGEPIEFDDYCESKSVKDAAIYLDLNEGFPDVEIYEKELEKRSKGQKKLNPEFASLSDDDLKDKIAAGHNFKFVGRVGSFAPIQSGCGGGIMYRVTDTSTSAVNGTKGYRWLESEWISTYHKEDDVDQSYFDEQVADAIKKIEVYGSYEDFLAGKCTVSPPSKQQPISDGLEDIEGDLDSVVPCGDGKYNTCLECPSCSGDVCKKGYSLANYIE